VASITSATVTSYTYNSWLTAVGLRKEEIAERRNQLVKTTRIFPNLSNKLVVFALHITT
jgi:hypothetical protein